VIPSPQGKAVALYYRDARRVEILTGLPAAAELLARVELAALPGILTELAVSDDGRVLAAAVSDGDRGFVYALLPDREVFLGAAGRVSALAFLNDSHDLLIADAGRGEILRIRDASAGGAIDVVASRSDGLDQPLAVRAAAGGRHVYAINAGDGRVAVLPLDGGAVEWMECPCRPTGLDPLAGGTLRLTGPSSSPMYILETAGGAQGAGRVLFVPVPGGSSPAGEASPAAPRGRGRR
jgi:hypothetical protein